MLITALLVIISAVGGFLFEKSSSESIEPKPDLQKDEQNVFSEYRNSGTYNLLICY